MSDVSGRVKAIVAKNLEVQPEVIVDEASFIEDLGADSLEVVELIMAFEEEFGLTVDDDDAEKIVSVGDAIRYIEGAKAR